MKIVYKVSMLEVLQDEFYLKLLVTLGVIVLTILLKFMGKKVINNWNIPSIEMRLKYKNTLKRVLSTILFFGIFIIWGASIKGFAVSIAAFAAALVLATKELLLCVLGSILKSSNQAFTFGDRIQIGTIRGVVIRQSLLGTTLMEIGPGDTVHHLSGKKIFIPNSQLLTQVVKNESLGSEYIFHSFQIVLKLDEKWKIHEKNLLKACLTEYEVFEAKAKKAIAALAKEKGIYKPSTEPKIAIDLSEVEKVKFTVRIACPEGEANFLEQKIIRIFLESI
ncbi:MAG TPA: mechanosensitive ion channel family protein [Oligoflexia bacterium]|nr:mechanosensitive ion channel family protein [Oligoflexia bacterium]HMR24063.1 mechanosensitive ion channel family protein [Oligoflexia bacterium]